MYDLSNSGNSVTLSDLRGHSPRTGSGVVMRRDSCVYFGAI